jgi:methyltransferase
MPGTTIFFLALVGIVAGCRIVELRLSRRHQRELAAGGAAALREPVFPAMVALHTGILAGAVAETLLLARPFVVELAIPAVVLVAAANALRFWVIATLGVHWNVRVVPSMPLGVVTGGPYRFVRHPNYVAVFVELAALPLVHGAYLTAIAGALLHAAVLRRRVGLEESVLMDGRSVPARLRRKPVLPFPRPRDVHGRRRNRGRRTGGRHARLAARAGGSDRRDLRGEDLPARKAVRRGDHARRRRRAESARAARRGGRTPARIGPLPRLRTSAEAGFPIGPDGTAPFALAQRRWHLDQALLAAARATPGVRVFDDARSKAPRSRADGRSAFTSAASCAARDWSVGADGPRFARSAVRSGSIAAGAPVKQGASACACTIASRPAGRSLRAWRSSSAAVTSCTRRRFPTASCCSRRSAIATPWGRTRATRWRAGSASNRCCVTGWTARRR